MRCFLLLLLGLYATVCDGLVNSVRFGSQLVSSRAEELVMFQQYLQTKISGSGLKNVLETISIASIEISSIISNAAIDGTIGNTINNNASGDRQKKLDVIANDILISALSQCDSIGLLASEENETFIEIAKLNSLDKNKMLVVFDPLDGSSNIDCAIPTGTIFGIYNISNQPSNILSEIKGSNLICAGYILYSASVEMVIAVDNVDGFTLDRGKGKYYWTRKSISVPTRGCFYSLNEGRSSDWPSGLIKYINNIKNGLGTNKNVKYSSRYVCSLVADFHRTLCYGGWCGNPRSHLRLLYEAAPLSYIAQKAKGKGSDGERNILDIVPRELHHRLPLFVGSIEDISEIESYPDVQQITDKKYFN